MAPGARSKFSAPKFEFEVFIGSKCIVLKKVLVTLLGLFGAPRSDSAPGKLFPHRLDGARGKKQVWHPHVRTWGLWKANALEESTYDIVGTFRRLSQWFGAPQCFSAPIVVRRPGNCEPLPALVTPLITLKIILNEKVGYHFCQVILLFWLRQKVVPHTKYKRKK